MRLPTRVTSTCVMRSNGHAGRYCLDDSNNRGCNNRRIRYGQCMFTYARLAIVMPGLNSWNPLDIWILCADVAIHPCRSSSSTSEATMRTRRRLQWPLLCGLSCIHPKGPSVNLTSQSHSTCPTIFRWLTVTDFPSKFSRPRLVILVCLLVFCLLNPFKHIMLMMAHIITYS
jgi:hypothetical protein